MIIQVGISDAMDNSEIIEDIINNDITVSYVNENKVYIDGNTNFTDTRISRGWSGDGTVSNPIIIDGIQIRGLPSDTLISIQNTDLYFIISNSYFNTSTYAIYLRYALHGKIMYNTIENSNYGIFLEYSDFQFIIGNNIIGNQNNDYGIYSRYADNNSISLNNVKNSYWGIYIEISEDTAIFENILISNNYNIYSKRARENSSITSNMVSGGVYGIFVYNTVFNYIKSNIISNSDYGIFATSATDITVIDNEITNADTKGIFVNEGYNNTVYGNKVYNNRIGMEISRQSLYTSESTNVSKNEIYNNYETGIKITLGRITLISDNTIYDNKEGIRLNFGVDHLIQDNIITDNDYGIILSSPENPILIQNSLINNGFFIEFYGDSLIYNKLRDINETNLVNGNPVFFSNNTVLSSIPSGTWGQILLVNVSSTVIDSFNIQNSSPAVFISHSFDISITNNNFSGNSIGLGVYNSDKITISNSIFSNNRILGIEMNKDSNITLIDNKIEKNHEGLNIKNSESVTIKDNYFGNNELNGMYMYSSSDMLINHNIFFANGYNGSLVLDNSGIDLNIIYDSPYVAINGLSVEIISNSTISDNTFLENAGYGVFLDGFAVVENNDFLHNSIRNITLDCECDYDTEFFSYSNDTVGTNYYLGINETRFDENNDGFDDELYEFDCGDFSTDCTAESYVKPVANHHVATSPIITKIVETTKNNVATLRIHIIESVDTDPTHEFTYRITFYSSQGDLYEVISNTSDILISSFDLPLGKYEIQVFGNDHHGLTPPSNKVQYTLKQKYSKITSETTTTVTYADISTTEKSSKTSEVNVGTATSVKSPISNFYILTLIILPIFYHRKKYIVR